MSHNQIPDDVFDYISKVFRACNCRVSKKISAVPNSPEGSLDLTLIEQLSQFSSPKILPSNWVVRIDTHYLGGLHQYHRCEIADIGILLFLRQAGQLVRNKVILLQSKRLYPDSGDILEEDFADYQIGFAHLVPSGPTISSMKIAHVFSFSESSKYGAFRIRDKQWRAIKDYQHQRNIPVYYLFYNPWIIPFEQTLPLSVHPTLRGDPTGGCRIIPAKILFNRLQDKSDNSSPRFLDVCDLLPDSRENYCGWKLEYFVSRLLLGCIEGRIFQNPEELDLGELFFRRSGPIAAAIGINVEMPKHFD